MRKKMDLLNIALKNKKSSRKNFLLSVVALVEVILIMIVSTVAWIETTTSLQIKGTGDIDTYTYTTAEVGSGSDYNNKPIELSNYFRNAGNVHLAAASSANGKDIYFPKVTQAGTSASTYRKSNINDKNVNYISFSFKVKAATSTCNFYFNKVPTIKIGDEKVTNNDIRIAITASNTTTIFSNNASASESVVANVSGATSLTSVKAFKDYINEDDKTKVFSVSRGATETVTVTLWLQSTDTTAKSEYAGKTVTVEDFALVTGAAKIKFVDRTTGFNGSDDTSTTNGWHWIDNYSPALLLYDSENRTSYTMTKDADFATNKTWTVQIPQSLMDDTSKTLYVCRCASGVQSISSLTDSNVWNYWQLPVSQAITEKSSTFTAYGATDSSDKVGYGTWGEVVEIQLDTEDTSTLSKPSNANNATNVTLSSTSNSSVVCEMNYNSQENATNWKGFVPASASTNLRFSFGSHTINASNRNTSQKFVVTSASTGYWDPPVTVTAAYASGSSATMGTISVSGGKSGATSVKVTKGTSVTYTATPSSGYEFDGWYESSGGTGTKHSNNYAYTANANKTLYAKFKTKTLTGTAHAGTDGTSNSSTGGTVKCGSGAAGSTSSATVNYGSSVTLTATVKSGFKFDGWYDSATGGSRISSNSSYTLTNITTDRNVYARFTTSTNTIYFCNSYSWSGTIKCYTWVSTNESDNNTWSGVAMTYVGNNGYGQAVYKITLDSKYDRVIFNNGSYQTVDIKVSDILANGNNGCYITGQSGSNYTVGYAKYSG